VPCTAGAGPGAVRCKCTLSRTLNSFPPSPSPDARREPVAEALPSPDGAVTVATTATSPPGGCCCGCGGGAASSSVSPSTGRSAGRLGESRVGRSLAAACAAVARLASASSACAHSASSLDASPDANGTTSVPFSTGTVACLCRLLIAPWAALGLACNSRKERGRASAECERTGRARVSGRSVWRRAWCSVSCRRGWLLRCGVRAESAAQGAQHASLRLTCVLYCCMRCSCERGARPRLATVGERCERLRARASVRFCGALAC
jgi:hypothetical protein